MSWSRGGREVLKILATSVCFTLCRIRRKVIYAKGNPSLQILEYSTPRQKFKTQIWISNFVGKRISRWHLGINSFWHQLGSSLEYFRWHLGIISFWRQLGYLLGLEIPGDSSFLGFLFAFPCWVLICFSFRGELNISVGFYYSTPFVGNYTNHQKYKIAYVPLDQFSDYVYIVDLNNRLHVGWKTLPNLNYKPKFKT